MEKNADRAVVSGFAELLQPECPGDDAQPSPRRLTCCPQNEELLAKAQHVRRDEALRHATTAAEAYMNACAEARGAGPRSHLRQKAKEMLDLAERLKKSHVPAKSAPATHHLRQITSEEQDILRRASRLHGNDFPPWQSNPPEDAFRPAQGGVPYSSAPLSHLLPFSFRVDHGSLASWPVS